MRTGNTIQISKSNISASRRHVIFTEEIFSDCSISCSQKNRPKCGHLVCRNFTGTCAHLQHLVGNEGGRTGQREKSNCDPDARVLRWHHRSSLAGGPCRMSWTEARQPLCLLRDQSLDGICFQEEAITLIWVDVSEGQFLERMHLRATGHQES